MAFNTSRQSHKFNLGLQYLEMVNNYIYLGIIIDWTLTFAWHVAETKREIDSRFKRDQDHHKSDDWCQHQDAHSSVQFLVSVCPIICCFCLFTSLQFSLTVLRTNTNSPTVLHLGPSQWYKRHRGLHWIRNLAHPTFNQTKLIATYLLTTPNKPTQTEIMHGIQN
jgi:hypothetical protein